MIKRLPIRPLVIIALSIAHVADGHAADVKPSRQQAQGFGAFSLNGGYSHHFANGGSNFFGAGLNLYFTPHFQIFVALNQSLSAGETARTREHEETFVQRAERILRIESGLVSPLWSTSRLRLQARGGISLWRSELHTTIEDTPMGNFYNFAPMNLTSLAGQAGLELQTAVVRHLELNLTAAYHFVPNRTYTASYAMMGMFAEQNFVLRLSGLSFGLGVQFGLQ
jgi:hypothetical protein